MKSLLNNKTKLLYSFILLLSILVSALCYFNYKANSTNSILTPLDVNAIKNSELLFLLYILIVIISVTLIIINIRKQAIKAAELLKITNSKKAISDYSRSLIEASLDSLVTISNEGKITDVNQASILVTGRTRENLIGTDFSDYFTEPERAKEAYLQVFQNGFVADYPLSIKHVNGNLTHVLYNASLYKDDKGKVLGAFAAARDVTKQKISEANLDKTLKELSGYKYALDQSSIVGITDENGIISYANENFVKISKYTKEELIGQDHKILNSGYHSSAFMINLWITIKKGEIWRGEIKNKAKDGSFYWVDTTIVPFLEKDGHIYQYVAVRTDVTAKKILSQYSLSLIEATLDPLVTINNEGKITDMNEATVKITGVERIKLIGSDFFDYFTEPQKAREVYQEVFAKGYVTDSPLTLRHKGGKLTDVLFNGSIYKDDTGNVLGVVIVARDVTAQKLLSNYSLSLIEASRDPLFTISPTGKITDMNEATLKAIGISREKLIDTDFFNYFTEPDNALKGYQQVFDQGFVVDYPLTLKDSKRTDVLFNGSVYKDNRGNVLGAVVVARDITDQKRIKKELIEARVAAELATGFAEEAKSKAEDAVKAKQQFLSNMSHEIRTPMNAIIGFTKVVLKTDLTSKQKEYLTAIKMSGDALIVLINDILDLAKVDAGKMTFEKTPFKLSLSISAMIHLFETKIQEKNLELIKDYDPSIPEVLLGDSVRLHQIILNLLSNAVKFTSRGKIIVGIKLIDENKDTVSIEFSVTDTGIGISENKLEHIFENFQQASSGTSRLYGGTGLGLAIVKQLVEPQGGTINVKSKLNEGSTFSFILNFTKTIEKIESLPEIEYYEKYMKKIKILVVEDIPLNQLLMKTLLDDFGFERDIAANGKIAIEKLQAKSYDIVLMDLQMPEMNGFEATEYIRTVLKSDIPIIALTADVTSVDLEKCKAVGMNDYISKPVDEKILYSKIIGLVKKKSSPPSIDDELIEVENLSFTNLDYLHKLTKSDSKLMMEMISLYLAQTPPLIIAMTESCKDKNWSLLYSAVHKMISSFSIMGISVESENIAKKIQEYAKTPNENEEIHDQVFQIEKVCKQACIELKEEYDKLKMAIK